MARPPLDEDRPATLAEIASGTAGRRMLDRAARDRQRADKAERRSKRGREVWAVPRPRSRVWGRIVGWLAFLLVLGLLGGGAAVAGVAYYLNDAGRTPREWAPYLLRRASGNHWIFTMLAGKVSQQMLALDRLEREGDPVLPPQAGAAAERSGAAPRGRLRLVANEAQLRGAVDAAMPGDVIQLLPGSYGLGGRGIRMERGGTAAAPIVLRAERLGDAVISSGVAEAFKVSSPYWVIENLVVRGVCESHTDCEHAIHVVGGGANVLVRNNRMEDFNAHIKVNGEGGAFPDHGRVEGNTMTNTAGRDTKTPVTPIDLVAASHWRIVGNFIADFQRAFDGGATYGAFMKGEGEGTVMERNVILCEWKLRHARSPTIGLSVGGGGTYPDAVKRQLGALGVEQTNGVIRDNLIAFCNDVGIYVNKGRSSVVAHNTVLDTAGIGVRFAESSAQVVGNLVDGVVQTRDGALVRERDNLASPLLGLFLGQHPVREMFRDVAKFDLRWRERPPQVGLDGLRTDLCGAERMGRGMPGAFDDYAACRGGPSATPAAAAPAGPAARRP